MAARTSGVSDSAFSAIVRVRDYISKLLSYYFLYVQITSWTPSPVR